MSNKTFQRGDLIGHPFANADLLTQALRHRSAGVPNNERLEFLGDSIVNMLVAQALYARWPSAPVNSSWANGWYWAPAK